MVVIVRLDLDRYDASTLQNLVREGVVTIGEACEAKSIKVLSEYERLMWVRATQRSLAA